MVEMYLVILNATKKNISSSSELKLTQTTLVDARRTKITQKKSSEIDSDRLYTILSKRRKPLLNAHLPRGCCSFLNLISNICCNITVHCRISWMRLFFTFCFNRSAMLRWAIVLTLIFIFRYKREKFSNWTDTQIRKLWTIAVRK